MKFIFIICIAFFNYFSASESLKAAEKINIEFEEMSIPITIDQLSNLEDYSGDSKEIIEWFKENGFKKIFELSKFLEFPVFRQEGFSKNILRSWMGRKILSELSNTIIIPEDTNGIEFFNTIENLLEKKNEISTLDILKEIPAEEIFLDIDNLITIISSWKKELLAQQNLVKKLNQIEGRNQLYPFKSEKKDFFYEFKSSIKELHVSHRENLLRVEVWEPIEEINNRDLIIFMPGLGGAISNFRWIGKELSRRGWPVVFIEHEGSNSEALEKVIKGTEAMPGGADIYLYRVKDLHSVIIAHEEGLFGFKEKSYILMGHSLGSLVSFLYEGNSPIDGFKKRCDRALVDFALTNLSKLLQCQLSEIPIPSYKGSNKLKALIGFNSFGSLIWPHQKKSGIRAPILLIGGTYDLITPLLNEQFKIFLSTKSNSLNRFLVIEGASHFSPIRVMNNNSDKNKGTDIFKIRDDLIGSHPNDVQNLAIKIILKFLDNLNDKNGLDVLVKSNENNLIYHLLGEEEIEKISQF